VKFISLTNYPTLISLAVEKGLVELEDQNTLLKWSQDPAGWGR
jgi:orotate phosphoribosyltransferase